MKKFLIVLIVCIFLLTSCTSVFTENDADEYEYQTFEKQNINLQQDNQKTVSLYFLSHEYDRLVAETRVIEIEYGKNYSQQIITELLNGPEDTSLRPIISDCTLDKVESLYNVENVYISSSVEHMESTYYTFALAAANALYNFSGKAYVNLYVNGKPLSYEGNPVGCVSYNQGIVADENSALIQKNISKSYNAALYFLDESGEFLVPEIRNIDFKTEDYAKTIVDELLNGPQTMYYCKQSVNESLSVVGDTAVRENEDGTRILVINLNKSLNLLSSQDKKTSVGAIVYSVLGFMPNIDGIKFTANGKDFEENIYTKNDFADMLGNEITLYFANEAGIVLSGVNRTVLQSRAGLPQTILEELIKGPQKGEGDNLVAVFPEGVDEYDINQVYIAGDIAVVNFSSGILSRTQEMTEEQEKIMIYSVVDSLTNLQGIKSVQFLIDGNVTDNLCGYIDISDPILKNPGIIKY